VVRWVKWIAHVVNREEVWHFQFVVIEKYSRLIFNMLKSNIFYESHKLPNNSIKWNTKRYDIGLQLKR
jgi:hypothetical protein